MELSRYLAIGRRWLWLIILMPAVSGFATYLFDLRRAPVYQAQVQLLVGPALSSTNVDLNELRVSSQLIPVYSDMVQTRPILESVIEELDLTMTPERLKSRVKAIPIEEAQVLRIQVQDPSPYRAVQIANAMADVLIARSPTAAGEAESVLRDNIQTRLLELSGHIGETDTAITELELQLRQSPGTEAQQALLAQLKAIRAQLQDSYTTLASLYAQLPTKSVNKIEVVEAAIPDLKPVSPRVTLDVLLGALVGLVAATSFAVFLEYVNDKVNSAEDLSRVIGETVSVRHQTRPKLQREGENALESLWPEDSPGADSFRILRANLHSLEQTRSSMCLMVTNPDQTAGRSEFAANLAVAFAEAGEYVILVEADLQNSQLAQLFDIGPSTDPEPGLKSPPFETGLVEVPLKRLGDKLQILPGRTLPAGSSTSVFINSPRWEGMLEEYKIQANIVILVAPPVLNRADTLILARQADAVLLVVNRGESTRRATNRALDGLQMSGVKVIATILNRSIENGYSRLPVFLRRLRSFLRGLMAGFSPQVSPPDEEVDPSGPAIADQKELPVPGERAEPHRPEENGRQNEPVGLSGLGWSLDASTSPQLSPATDKAMARAGHAGNGRSKWPFGRLPLRSTVLALFGRWATPIANEQIASDESEPEPSLE